MAVGSGIPFNVHTGTGAATVFAYSFTLLDAGDLVVTVAGVPTTAYAVFGVGSAGGGSVAFSVPPALGATVILSRVIALARETDYQNNGDLLAPTLNGDFDRLWMAMQQGADASSRAIRAPFPETLADLPPASERAGMLLGFNDVGAPVGSLPPTGSAAEVILDLASTGPGQGAAMVRFVSDLALANQRTAMDKLRECVSIFEFMTDAQVASWKAGDLAIDMTAALQTCINSARGRRIYMPKGRGAISAPLVINTVVSGSARPFVLFGDGYDANGGSDGTSLHQTSASADCLKIENTGNTDSWVEVCGLGLFGRGAETVTAGRGVSVNNCSNVRLRDLWVQGFHVGVYFFRCYGGGIEDSYVFRNRVRGILATEAFNLGSIRRVKCYHNGFDWSVETGAIALNGAGNENLGTVLENIDVSYAGMSATSYSRAAGSLVSIVVASGVATATTAAAHGRSTGDRLAVSGASVSPELNTQYSTTLTVTSATTFTFSTPAADGTYTESSLRIGPYAVGLSVGACRGLIAQVYSEDCSGPAVYVGANVTGADIVLQYIQGTSSSGFVVLDDCTAVKVRGGLVAGPYAKLAAATTARPHAVDVASSVAVSGGASITYGPVKMLDGVYYAAAAPAAGTWQAGAYVKRLTPAVGQPKGWYCTVGGTPGTWVSEGNL